MAVGGELVGGLGRPRRGVEVAAAAGSSVDLPHPLESACEPEGASRLNQEGQARL